MTQLGDEIIPSYDTGPDGAEVETIVEALLAFQRKATKITKGTISVTGTRALSIDSPRSILSALLQLQESVGGYLYVDNDLVLQWPTDIGEDKGQQIRYRKNLISIEEDEKLSEYCTKLHITGGGESLSDIEVGPVSPTITTDETYAYFTLAEIYAAYLGWTGEGDALPANIKVWRENASPTWRDAGGSCSGGSWVNPSNGSDGDTGTYAEYLDIPGGGGASTPLTCDVPDATYNRVRYYVWMYGSTGQRIKIDVYSDGEWQTVYDGDPGSDNAWHEVGFAARNCTHVRIIFYNTSAYSKDVNVHELQLLEADEVDVTSDFEQGAWENIIRCAVGDYDSGETYTIEYTHADYLVAWDKIVDADDIVAKVATNKYEAYAISLREAGILLLDEMKEVPVSISIDTLDLSRNGDWNFDFEKLQLGSIVAVIVEVLDISVSIRVVKITKPDLLSSQQMKLELSTRVKDISTYLADLHKRF